MPRRAPPVPRDVCGVGVVGRSRHDVPTERVEHRHPLAVGCVQIIAEPARAAESESVGAEAVHHASVCEARGAVERVRRAIQPLAQRARHDGDRERCGGSEERQRERRDGGDPEALGDVRAAEGLRMRHHNGRLEPLRDLPLIAERHPHRRRHAAGQRESFTGPGRLAHARTHDIVHLGRHRLEPHAFGDRFAVCLGRAERDVVPLRGEPLREGGERRDVAAGPDRQDEDAHRRRLSRALARRRRGWTSPRCRSTPVRRRRRPLPESRSPA